MHVVSILAAFATLALAQNPSGIQSTGTVINFDPEHNATNIIGSWSSGSRNVTTGSAFANPAQMSFTYPATAGVAYAFDGDGNYELSRYRFVSNGSQPNCITGTLVWAHGKYNILNNGSIILVPLGDGFQQVQAACAAESNFIQVYNQTEYFPMWRIFSDPTDGPKLHLWQFDGQPVAPLFQTSSTPNMLPTQILRNVTEDPSAGTTVLNQRRRRSFTALFERSSGAVPHASIAGVGVAAFALGAAALAVLF